MHRERVTEPQPSHHARKYEIILFFVAIVKVFKQKTDKKQRLSLSPLTRRFMPTSALVRPLILASTSPYRRALLERLHLPFTPRAPRVDEAALPNECPADTALRLAVAKARAAVIAGNPELIIGSDQVADLNGEALGKPGDHRHAALQLRAMRGQSVVFHTALCLLDAASGRYQLENVPSTVRFRDLSDAQIETYLQREQPYDCAGSAKIEALGVALILGIDSSDPTALIGLPLMTLVSMLKREQIEVI